MFQQFLILAFWKTTDLDKFEQFFKDGYNPNQLLTDIYYDSLRTDFDFLFEIKGLLQIMIKYGLDVNKSINHHNIFIINAPYSVTTLAILFGDLELIKYIINVGADVNKLVNNHGAPIHAFGYTKGDIHEFFTYLRLIGGNFKLQGYKGETPLDYTFASNRTFFRNQITKCRWKMIKFVTIILGIHKRAVERVYHPDRLLEQGTFNELF